MSMRNRILVLCGALLVLVSSISSTAAAQGDGQSEACFMCENFWSVEYKRYEHCDGATSDPDEFHQGIIHIWCDWTTCINALAYAGHQLYSLEEFPLASAQAALLDGRDEALLTLLERFPKVELNSERSALQIMDQRTNEVVYHAILPSEQVKRLVDARQLKSGHRDAIPGLASPTGGATLRGRTALFFVAPRNDLFVASE